MARKRMISPEIWDSSSFSKLSDFAKLVFIGLISNADDEGKGKANPGYIRSKMFPNDEERRVTDIKKALSEIALNMSITFYEAEGDTFYLLTNWARWQAINRPTPSKIPNPPNIEQPLGERGESTQNQKLTEDSVSTHGGLTEGSRLIEKNRIEKNIYTHITHTHTRACAREETPTPFEAFIQRWGISCNSISNYSGGKLAGINWEAVSAHVQRSSKFLQKQKALPFFIDHYEKILDGTYDDLDEPEKKNGSDFDSSRFENIQYE